LSGASAFTLASVSNDESASGDSGGWILGTADIDCQLRAERSGSGGGRTYSLLYRGSDAAGNPASCVATILVPRSR
jgi:hypothetical protein